MALHQPALGRTSEYLVRVLFILAAVLAVIAIATAVFGVQISGPSYDLTVDPAHLSGLPF